MRNQLLGIVALGIALAISPAAIFAKGGGSAGGGGAAGGGAQHFSSTGGAAQTGAGNSAGTKTPRLKSVSKIVKQPCGGIRSHGGGPNPGYTTNPPCSGSSGGASASRPPTCQAGGAGCYRQP
jgi:hypothetical protein